VDVTPELLVRLERRYAPHVGTLPGVFSRWEVERLGDGNAGGDKMAADRNGYADAYASLLSGLDPATVVELGVFQGVSVAMWCDLFPDAHVVGLDLEFSRFDVHRPVLLERGAFSLNRPILLEFDAYGAYCPLDGLPSVDLFIDDGPHTAPAIANVLEMMGPRMSRDGVYVVEDFDGGGDLLARAFPKARIVCYGRLSAALL
jgi:predicted O-methyltransferase YrrM